MSKFHQGFFEPVNTDKYQGTYPITYRSSWELTFMNLCDQHPNVIMWSSESLKIPYIDPMGKSRNYIPDFMIVYLDVSGKRHCEMIEIKPMSQSLPEAAKSKKDREAQMLNEAKWYAATQWCKMNGFRFRVMTEKQLYR